MRSQNGLQCCFFLMLFVFAHVLVNVRHETQLHMLSYGVLILAFWFCLVSFLSLLTGLVYPTCSVVFPSSVPHPRRESRKLADCPQLLGCGGYGADAGAGLEVRVHVPPESSTGDWCRRAWSKPKTHPRVKTQSNGESQIRSLRRNSAQSILGLARIKHDGGQTNLSKMSF